MLGRHESFDYNRIKPIGGRKVFRDDGHDNSAPRRELPVALAVVNVFPSNLFEFALELGGTVNDLENGIEVEVVIAIVVEPDGVVHEHDVRDARGLAPAGDKLVRCFLSDV